MITSDFRKKMADSWFSYLQNQICKEFEYLEKILYDTNVDPYQYYQVLPLSILDQTNCVHATLLVDDDALIQKLKAL